MNKNTVFTFLLVLSSSFATSVFGVESATNSAESIAQNSVTIANSRTNHVGNVTNRVSDFTKGVFIQLAWKHL